MKKLLIALTIGVMGFSMAQTNEYASRCVGCHQATGAGLPGVFPPLAGHVPEILAAKDGREWLIKTVLFGLQGPITVKGQNYNGVMPAFGNLTDAQIAGILNHISTQWGNKLPANQRAFTADEVKAMRAKTFTPAQVGELRKALGLK